VAKLSTAKIPLKRVLKAKTAQTCTRVKVLSFSASV
jgi:hypothetical protein